MGVPRGGLVAGVLAGRRPGAAPRPERGPLPHASSTLVGGDVGGAAGWGVVEGGRPLRPAHQPSRLLGTNPNPNPNPP